MSNNKQSSVIWFAIESWKLGMQLQNQEISKDKHSVLWVDLLVKAKAMHKEEIKDAFQEGQEIPPLDDTKDEYSPMTKTLNYYKETYGGNK
jgi:hypothetical protein